MVPLSAASFSFCSTRLFHNASFHKYYDNWCKIWIKKYINLLKKLKWRRKNNINDEIFDKILYIYVCVCAYTFLNNSTVLDLLASLTRQRLISVIRLGDKVDRWTYVEWLLEKLISDVRWTATSIPQVIHPTFYHVYIILLRHPFMWDWHCFPHINCGKF